MIKTYDNLRSEKGDLITGRTKLFIIDTKDDGSINQYLCGVSIVPEVTGTMFIVDEWLLEQIDKITFVDGELSVKDDEELEEPVKSERELQREELLRQLADLESDNNLK